MKAVKTKVTIGVLSTLIAYVSLNSLLHTTNPELFIHRPEDREERQWIATSKSWLDRKACRWLGFCGLAHIRFVGRRFGHHPDPDDDQHVIQPDLDWEEAWNDTKDRPEDWTDDERILREIPDYVIEYAPLVHLFSGEQFWPCDIAEHLYHITPSLNYTPISGSEVEPTLKHLDELNEFQGGKWVYLTSKDNVEDRPEWLEGEKNMPTTGSRPEDGFEDNDGWVHHAGRSWVDGVKDVIHDLKDWFAPGMKADLERENDYRKSRWPDLALAKNNNSWRGKYHDELRRRAATKPDEKIRGGKSDAPAVLVTVNKGHGIVDAFWFFFYSFNLGNVVFNVRFGNHVGDWEHTMIRFHHGKPKAVFFSEHNFGSAYSYEAVEKLGKRPVVYSAVGTHAMYATAGMHPYILPWGILHDQTDRGPLWDPTLNSHAYTYDPKNDTVRASNLTPQAPTAWFHFAGRWGDKYYRLGDKRQYRFVGQYHYVSGPLGPKFKDLDRKKVCAGPDDADCVIKHWLGGTDNVRLATTLDEFEWEADNE
ncbi:hypothetical protein DV736_g2660, partial [Chaetothyriales sp. CBS 134916]